jgi:soluble lytic murein transglycosylase-like protein
LRRSEPAFRSTAFAGVAYLGGLLLGILAAAQTPQPAPPPSAVAAPQPQPLATADLASALETGARIALCAQPSAHLDEFLAGDAEPTAEAPPDIVEAAVPPPPLIGPQQPTAPSLWFDSSYGVPKTPFGKQIYKVASRFALNPLLIAAVVEAESDFNPRAISRKGARGLMQVLPATARRFGYRRRDLLNPGKNLEAGARYLRWLFDRFGDDALRVLAAYNAGEGSVDRFGGLPPFAETRDYVQRIFARLGFTALLPVLDVAGAGGLSR